MNVTPRRNCVMHKARIVTQQSDDRPNDWRWFAALMLMCQFFPVFYTAGLSAWSTATGDRYSYPVFPVNFVTWLWIVRALCFAGLARALIRRSRWAALLIVVLLGLTTWGMVANIIRDIRQHNPPTSWGIDASDPYTAVWEIFQQYGASLPWLVMLVVGVWRWWAERHGRTTVTRTWVQLAAAWCISSAPALASYNHALFWFTSPGRALPVYSNPALYIPAVMVLSGVLLLMRSRYARTAVLMLVAASVAVTVMDAYLWWLLHHATFGAFAQYDQGTGTPWTRNLFESFFINPIAYVGPWLVIACFARWAPMANPVDDGSPFPRRYCGRCGYNLHGIDSDVCPECGATLAEPEAKAAAT